MYSFHRKKSIRSTASIKTLLESGKAVSARRPKREKKGFRPALGEDFFRPHRAGLRDFVTPSRGMKPDRVPDQSAAGALGLARRIQPFSNIVSTLSGSTKRTTELLSA
jgi:hypothetical protein